MINSRSLDTLNPAVRPKVDAFLQACHVKGIDILVTSTYRDVESQNALYAQGRTTPGNIVTNAKGGQSFHNYCCAIDIVPLRLGKPVWGTTGEDGKLWDQVGAIGESCGLEWAAHWPTFKEECHFQYTGGLTLAQLQAGAVVS